jgi:hypothetical protein
MHTASLFYFPHKAADFIILSFFLGGGGSNNIKVFYKSRRKFKYLPRCLKVDRPTPLRFVYIAVMTSKRRNLAAAEDGTAIQPMSSHFAD